MDQLAEPTISVSEDKPSNRGTDSNLCRGSAYYTTDGNDPNEFN